MSRFMLARRWVRVRVRVLTTNLSYGPSALHVAPSRFRASFFTSRLRVFACAHNGASGCAQAHYARVRFGEETTRGVGVGMRGVIFEQCQHGSVGVLPQYPKGDSRFPRRCRAAQDGSQKRVRGEQEHNGRNCKTKTLGGGADAHHSRTPLRHTVRPTAARRDARSARDEAQAESRARLRQHGRGAEEMRTRRTVTC